MRRRVSRETPTLKLSGVKEVMVRQVPYRKGQQLASYYGVEGGGKAVLDYH